MGDEDRTGMRVMETGQDDSEMSIEGPEFV